MTPRLSAFAPMRETRVAGKGGQFAKGGGRVPGRQSPEQARAALTKANCRAVFETFEHEGYTATVSEVEPSVIPGGVTVTGHLVAPDGTLAGDFSRDLYYDAERQTLVMHHASLLVEPQFQNQGVGGAFVEQTLSRAQELGVSEVTLTALSARGSSVGALVWAKEGFETVGPAPEVALAMRGRARGESMRRAGPGLRGGWLRLASRLERGEAQVSELLEGQWASHGAQVLTGSNGAVTWEGRMRL